MNGCILRRSIRRQGHRTAGVAVIGLLAIGFSLGPGDAWANKRKVERPAGWLDDLDRAVEQANKENKVVFVLVLDGLYPSRQMRMDIMKKPVVVSMLSRFVPVELIVGENDAQIKRFESPAVPLVGFVDKENYILYHHRIENVVDEVFLIGRMQLVLNDIKQFQTDRETVRSNPTDLDTRLRLGTAYQKRQLNREAIEQFRGIINADPKLKSTTADIRDQAKAGWAQSLLSLGVRSFLYGDRKEGISVLEEFLKDFPNHDQTPRAHYYLSLAYMEEGRKTEAVKTIKQDEMARKMIEALANQRARADVDDKNKEWVLFAREIISSL